MNPEHIKQAQAISKKMLIKLDSVCEKYNITYFLDSGALIGAIREKNLIAWDDDIDIAFKREDYEKLLKVPKEEWGEDMELVTYSNIVQGGQWLDFITRFVYLKEEVPINVFNKIKNINPNYRNKVVMDIFVFDVAYDSKIKQKLKVFQIKTIYGLAMGHRENLDYGKYGGITKIFVILLSKLGKKLKLENIISMYEKATSSVNKKNNKLFCSSYTMKSIGKVFEKAWFKETVKVQLGEDFVDAPIGFHNILTVLYGDYMTPPSCDLRKPEHVYDIC